MLVIQDVHVVVGREEIPFEDAYRHLAPQVATDTGTRLAAFFWLPHGAGEGYEAVALTAVADLDALERHQTRLATGDLADHWLELEGKQRRLDSSLHRLAEWSPLARGGVEAFALGEHPTALYRLDSFTVAGAIDDAVAACEAGFRSPPADAVVEIVGCWSTYLGELDAPVVSVLGRVASDDALRSVLSEPAEPWPGVPDLPGARCTTRLLRSVGWSPLH